MKKIRYSVIMAMVLVLVLFGRGSVTKANAAVKPEIVLIGYDVNEGFVFGEETYVNISLKNMNETITCSAVLVSYTSANTSVIPSLGHSNQLFIQTLEPGQEVTLPIPVVINDRGDGYASMTFNIEYSVENVGMFNSTCYIVFPVGDESVAIRNVNMTTETTIGANSLVSVSFDNLLKTDITNVKLVVSGDVSDGETSYVIGNVAAKATKYAEYYLQFKTAGKKSVKLQLVYTLDNGEVSTKDIGEYSINVKEGTSRNESSSSSGQGTPSDQPEQQPSGMSLSMIFLGLGALLIIATVVVFVVTKIRNND